MTHKRKLKHIYPPVALLLYQAYDNCDCYGSTKIVYECLFPFDYNLLFELANMGVRIRYNTTNTFELVFFDLFSIVDRIYENRMYCINLLNRP